MILPLIYIPNTKYKYFLEIKPVYYSTKTIIPIGKNCHSAQVLKVLGLRKFSLPYDWIRLTTTAGLGIVSDNINKEFRFFQHDLQKNKAGNTFAEHYPDAEFTHSKNINSDELVKQKYKRRCKRMLKIIRTEDVAYLFHFHIADLHNEHNLNKFLESIHNFAKILKPDDTLHIYGKDDDITEECEKHYQTLVGTLDLATKYTLEEEQHGIWGDYRKYPQLIKDLGMPVRKKILPSISLVRK